MNPLVYFEIPVADMKRACLFYERVFEVSLELPGNLPITQVDGITSPRALYGALNDAAMMLDVELEWVDVIPLIAQLDWITAAVIAKDTGHDVPELPSFDTLVSQRSLMSLRRMGKVTIGAEWGNDMHELMMSFEQWLRILGGQDDRIEKPYIVEGARIRVYRSATTPHSGQRAP